jgi:hypothetical protein
VSAGCGPVLVGWRWVEAQGHAYRQCWAECRGCGRYALQAAVLEIADQVDLAVQIEAHTLALLHAPPESSVRRPWYRP